MFLKDGSGAGRDMGPLNIGDDGYQGARNTL